MNLEFGYCLLNNSNCFLSYTSLLIEPYLEAELGLGAYFDRELDLLDLLEIVDV